MLYNTLPDDTPYEALITLAEFHQKLANELKAKADAKAQSNLRRQSIANRKAKLAHTARIAYDLMKKGLDKQQALKQACEAQHIQSEAVALILPAIIKKDKAHDLVKIMRLARHGWTNQAIAKKFGIHEQTVGRLIRNAWKS